MDGLIFGSFDLFVFFIGKSIARVKEDVKRDFFPALILEGGMWPIVQRLFVEQQKDAPWKTEVYLVYLDERTMRPRRIVIFFLLLIGVSSVQRNVHVPLKENDVMN